MAKRPTPKSYQQILGEMLRTYMSKIGVDDLNTGSAVISFFEAMAQTVYRASSDTFAILRDFSVDRAPEEILRRIASEENVFLPPARSATGSITITDTRFEKIETRIYAGLNPPNIGATSIYVADASDFPVPTGSENIYIGRGSANIEATTYSTAPVNEGSYWRIDLDSPTQKFHNTNETVILGQKGVRLIPTNSVVTTDNTGSTPGVSYLTRKSATLLDGENEITGIPVTAQSIGAVGNVARNSIKKFTSVPFTGAKASNSQPFSNGRNPATVDEIRDAIKRARLSKGLGTAIAVKNSVLGIRASDEDATVTSNEIFSDGDETTLYIDNGEGYEEKYLGVGLEIIVDSALGGEDRFQLVTGGSQTSVVKAFSVSTEISPFNINPNDRLAFLVGGILSEHTFAEGDFRSNGAASAFEVVSSINANSELGFQARTSEEGTRVLIEAKKEINEFLEPTVPTSGTDANISLVFPEGEEETLKLYKNNEPLNRNGRQATIESENQSDWQDPIIDGETFLIAVDGTPELSYTILDSDFVAEGTHQTVSGNNTLQSWVNVLNSKVTGVTFSINGSRMVARSNLGADPRASLEINPSSTLVSKGVFSLAQGLSAVGRKSDYTFSRNTAQLKLAAPLEEGDRLTVGTDFTEGVLESTSIVGGEVTFTSTASFWFLVDKNDAVIISNGAISGSEIDVTKEANDVVRYTSSIATAFSNVQVGDYVIVWSGEVNATNRLEGRVYATTNDSFDLRLTPTEFAAATAEAGVVLSEGIVFVRTDKVPRKVNITLGTYPISTIANSIESQLDGVDVTTKNDEQIIISTADKDVDGGILLVTANEQARAAGLPEGELNTTTLSHYGFLKSSDDAGKFPLFIHSSMADDREANTPTSYIADFESSISLASIEPSGAICMQHPYLSFGSYVEDAQAYDECAQIDTISGTTIDIDDAPAIRRVRANDRYYLLAPLDIHFNDRLSIILDSNPFSKTFPVNLYRRAITNATTGTVDPTNFRAYDLDGGSLEFTTFFTGFSFKNYKVLMKARNAIDPAAGAVDEDAILFRSALWGRAGEKYNISYQYPTAADQAITSTVVITDEVDVNIFLKSGAAVPNDIDGTTEWDVSVTTDTPVVGVDEVTYSYNATGTDPAMTTLVAGSYVTINDEGEFNSSNQGTFKISSANSTSFTVRRPGGVATNQTGVATLSVSTISLYESSNTAATEVVDYITNELSEWIEAELLDDNGTNGTGIIETSTYEDTDFVTEKYYLLDGINWLESSNVGVAAPTPQFTFKETLQFSSFQINATDVYTFNDGEELRFIPVNIDQLNSLINNIAVTGLSSLGDIDAVNCNDRLQISTDVLGTSGSVFVSGGNGTISQALLVSTAIKEGSDLVKVNVPTDSSNGFDVGSMLKLEASFSQRKSTGISETTRVSVTPNSPVSGQSTITLSNSELTDRNFGYPRNSFRAEGRTFHIENHGSMVNLSWNETTGGDPFFVKTVEFNDVAGGNMSVDFNEDTGYTEYTITSGSRNFIECQFGDTVVIQNFTDPSNNGTFTVNGISNDGLTISTSNTAGVDAASAAVAGGDLVITTEVSEGDSLEIGSGFSSLNQGRFRVVRRYENSVYYENEFAVEEAVTVSGTARDLGFDGTTGFDVTVSGSMRVEWDSSGTTPSLSNCKLGDFLTLGTDFDADNQGTFMVLDSGDNYVEVANSKAVAESGITVADTLECTAPTVSFHPYENTRDSDSFNVSGNVLGSDNKGIYPVLEVLSKDKIVVSEVLTTIVDEQLNESSVQIFVNEGTPYTGYKKIANKAVNPLNTSLTTILLEGQNQYTKINEAGSILATTQSKLGYSESIKIGVDAYSYNTGLIAESNRTVYGDPRDNTTYPGSGAAGAEIYIKGPLPRRIVVSVNVRVNTGISFVRIADQVRNNIAALIKSSPVGRSIAISDIVSVINNITGIRAVSISSPQFDSQNDLIPINPNEKPFVLDIINDISVSKVE